MGLVVLELTVPFRPAHVGYLVEEANNYVVQFDMVFLGDETGLDKVNVLQILKLALIESHLLFLKLTVLVVVEGPFDHEGLESVVDLDPINILKYS